MSELHLPGLTRIRVQYLTPSALRITHTPLGAPFPADRPWLAEILLPPRGIAPEASRLTVDAPGGLARVRTRVGERVLAEARVPRVGAVKRQRSVTLDIPTVSLRPDFAQVTDAISLSFAIEADESFYGWGEWFNAFRRTQGEVKLKTRDAIALIQNRETYSGLPVFFSSRGYAVWLLNSHASEWKIKPEIGELAIEAAGPNADYIVMYGPTYKEIIRTYTELTGRPPLIPRWAFGLMVTGYPQEPQAVVEQRAHEHRQRRIPLDAIILDYHWEARYHNFQWRTSLIPNPQLLIANLHALGIKLGLILTPFVNSRTRPFQRWFLNTVASNLPTETLQDDERDLAGYAEGRAKNYFAHTDALWWFGAGGMVDFTNPAAVAWWNARMKPLYEQGIAFFKNDDGEYLPLDAHSHLGMSGREYHNLYGFFYSRALYEGMAGLGRGGSQTRPYDETHPSADQRPFIYARSVWVGNQRYPAIFLGDQKPTFEHLQSAMRAGLNMGLLGFAYWTADVFGLDGKTTPETHMRYAQWALLIPVARYFWRPPATDDTRFPWSHNAQVEENFRRITELRYRLLPYYYARAWEAYQTGLPILRPMLLEYQSDPRFADTYDQQMLGGDLLLAPVVEPGAVQRQIILPAGVWHDFWSVQTWAGEQTITYPAPLDRLPLLVRGGAIIPLGPVLQHIPDGHRFDQLQLHIYPPFPASGFAYDDDGLTRAYQRGEYTLTRFTAEGDEKQVWVRIDKAGELEIVLHRTVAPKRVQVDGKAISDWRFDAGLGALAIPASGAANIHIQFT